MAAETVIVACKLPAGIVLQNCVMEETNEVVQGGSRTIRRARRVEPTYTLNGNALSIDQVMSGNAPLIVDGFALTSGIPKDFWDKWAEDNKHAEYVARGFIKAFATEGDARKYARSMEKERTGLEPLDPAAPGRLVGRTMGGSVSAMQPGTTRAE